MINNYKNLNFKTSTEVRWWMAQGRHTDETLKEQIKAMHDAGFRGVELCQLNDLDIDGKGYGYGTPQWDHDVKLILNMALDLGMTVSLTSGAGWSTANIPGLDPDSQEANQCIFQTEETLEKGASRSGKLPTHAQLKEKARLIGCYAYKKLEENVFDENNIIELTDEIKNGELSFTAPFDCVVRYYYQQGTHHLCPPAIVESYCVNYFSRKGFEALKKYWETNVFNDKALNEKIQKGDVQLFMDSLEYHSGSGFTMWTEDYDKKFYEIKGYDIKPYMFLAVGIPHWEVWGWHDNKDLIGPYTLEDKEKSKKIINDIFDVQTRLYMNEFIKPLKEWLNSYGVTLRAQISYGKELEISQPIQAVDYPEAENRNQRNQVDMYRLWSGGAKLQNKVLSSETGGLDKCAYTYTFSRHLQEAYSLYAAGYSRIVWHIWSADYGPKATWPGYECGANEYGSFAHFYKFGTREPSYSDYPQFNAHLSRIQQLLREGKSGTDIGMLYTRYGQHLVYGTEREWLRKHETMFFPSTVLQDNGYTYDYFDPSFLTADGVYYDKENETLELAGYKALVLWQNVLSVSGAKSLLELAKDGLKLVITDSAALSSPYANENADELRSIINELKKLPNVKTVAEADDVIFALKELGVESYAGFSKPNRQLLTQVRRKGDDRYLYVYNYCDGTFHGEGEEPHGNICNTEIVMDGTYIPYSIDAWTGEKEQVPEYRIESNKTIIPINLEYGDVALFEFEKTEATDKKVTNYTVEYGAESEITDWSLTVESWVPGETLSRTETIEGVATTEYKISTDKENKSVTMNTLKTWDNIDEIGKNVSGKGYYTSKFNWNGDYNGAYIDFGKVVQSFKVKINGIYTDDINMNVPKVDISNLVKTGENTIEVEYSSNLTNVQLSRGIIEDGVRPNGFLGYETTYQSYGISKATVVPYNK